jgi:hypothetical protein
VVVVVVVVVFRVDGLVVVVVVGDQALWVEEEKNPINMWDDLWEDLLTA